MSTNATIATRRARDAGRVTPRVIASITGSTWNAEPSGKPGQVQMQPAVLVRGQAPLLLRKIVRIGPRAARRIRPRLRVGVREVRIRRVVGRVPGEEHPRVRPAPPLLAQVEERHAGLVVDARRSYVIHVSASRAWDRAASLRECPTCGSRGSRRSRRTRTSCRACRQRPARAGSSGTPAVAPLDHLLPNRQALREERRFASISFLASARSSPACPSSFASR